MLELYKLLVILLVVIIVYIEPLMKKNYDFSRNNEVTDSALTKHNIYCNINDTSQTKTHTPEQRGKHERHKRQAMPKSLLFYFETQEKLKKAYPRLFENLHKRLLLNTCPDYVKLMDTERLGECLMDEIEEAIHIIYDTEKAKLADSFSVGKIPRFYKNLDSETQKGGKNIRIAKGDVPLFHKLLKYRYFKKFDQFHLDFFHHLPLLIKNQIRNYFMYEFKGGFDVLTHERIHYLEEKVDEWILKCANHTRMGSLSQDALYEDEFLHHISPALGNGHLLYEVTEMDPSSRDNTTFLVY